MNWVFCQSFIVKPFWKYTNIQVHADDFEGKKRFIVKWFTVADFLYAWSYVYFYRGVTEENEAALSLFCNFGIFSQDQFCRLLRKLRPPKIKT